MTQDPKNPPSQAEITSFVIAAGNGEAAEVIAFADRCGDHINAWDGVGDTALTWAIARGKDDIVTLLLEKGARVDAADKNGKTPLIRAAWHGNARVASLLLDQGADINISDNLRKTPLMHAAQEGRAAVAALLLQRGARTGERDYDGCTALDIAEREKNEAADVIRKWVAEERRRVAAEEAEARARAIEALHARKLKNQRPKQSPFKKRGP